MKDTIGIEVYKSQHERFNKTRDLQWKMNITMWTLIVLGIGYVEKVAPYVCNCVIILLSLLVLAIHIVYIIMVQKSLERSKLFGRKILEQINNSETLTVEIEKWTNEAREKDMKSSAIWWILIQIIFTLVLIIMFIVIACNYPLNS